MSSSEENETQKQMAENQVVFRKRNAVVPEGFENLLKLAKEENQESLVELPTGLLHFRCECSDEDCEEKVKITLKTWQRIHRKQDEFVVARGHVVQEVEYVVKGTRRYQVVKKRVPPPQDASRLNHTPVNFHSK